MQTFIPCIDIEESANVIDKQRCWKQVVEGKTILKILNNKKQGIISGGGWANHPATRMWENYESGLEYYTNAFLKVCIEKWNFKIKAYQYEEITDYKLPLWFGYEPVHSSHRGRLLHKNEIYYSQFGWLEKPISESSGYYWPVDNDGNLKQEILSSLSTNLE